MADIDTYNAEIDTHNEEVETENTTPPQDIRLECSKCRSNLFHHYKRDGKIISTCWKKTCRGTIVMSQDAQTFF